MSQDSPITLPTTLKKSTSGSQPGKNQKSILGFFQKRTTEALQPNVNGVSNSNGSSTAQSMTNKKKLVSRSSTNVSQSLTPAPSSDAPEEDEEDSCISSKSSQKINGLPSPITPANANGDDDAPPTSAVTFSSPSRKVSYRAFRFFLTGSIHLNHNLSPNLLLCRPKRLSTMSNQVMRMRRKRKKPSNLLAVSPEQEAVR